MKRIIRILIYEGDAGCIDSAIKFRTVKGARGIPGGKITEFLCSEIEEGQTECSAWSVKAEPPAKSVAASKKAESDER